jgi:hypothetical protein
MHDELSIELTAASTRFDAEDERWLAQVDELAGELRQAGMLAASAGPTRAGQKGAVDQLILSVGSGGGFAAAVELVRAWLGRGRGRKVALEFFSDGSVKRCELSGGAEDEAHVAQLLRLLRNDESLR